MTGFEIFQAIASTGIGGAAILLVFRSGKTIEKINNIETKVSGIETDIKEIKAQLGHISERVSHLEGGFEERGRSEIIKLVEKK